METGRATAVFLLIVCGLFDAGFSAHQHKDGRIQMGVLNSMCDDGKTNLTVDFNGDCAYYTCYEDPALFLPNPKIHPLIQREYIPKGYSAPHFCMNESIYYDTNIPTFGPHRPIWPQYGEYKYVPKQRYIHNLEHGSIVMLYHPCADPEEVKFLKKIVKNCLYRHIITPSIDLNYERPLALISWGYRMLMSKMDMELAIKFIKKHANRAPEKTAKDGQYNAYLMQHAAYVSGPDDREICPFYNMK